MPEGHADVSVATEIKKAAHLLRDWVAKYDQLSEVDQKATRHLIYKGAGNYGKAVVEIFPRIREISTKLAADSEGHST